MNFLIHLIVNFIIGFILYFSDLITERYLLIFILFGVLIDIDHVLYFSIKYKTLNLKKLYLIGKKLREKMQTNLYIFHSPEFNVLILILSFYNIIFLLLLISNIIHIILDVVEHYLYHKNFHWIKRWSIIYSFIPTTKFK